MATVRTIGGTSPDYSTIQAWEDAAPSTLTDIWEGRVRSGTYQETVVIGGSTSTVSNFKLLTYDDGAFHGGEFAAGPVIWPSESQAGHTIDLAENHAKIVGLEIRNWSGLGACAVRMNGATAATGTVEQCIIHSSLGSDNDGHRIDGGISTLYVSNNLYAFLGRAAVNMEGGSAAGSTVYAYNCTAVYGAISTLNGRAVDVPYNGIFSFGYGTFSTTTRMVLKNCYAHALPSPDAFVTTCYTPAANLPANCTYSGSTHNAGSDTTTPGTNAKTNITPEGQIVKGLSALHVSENPQADITGTLEMAEINGSSPTTNYGSNQTVVLDDTGPRKVLMRQNLSNVSSSVRVRAPAYYWRTTVVNELRYKAYDMKRAWVESEVTYNQYASGQSWQTAGATGADDIGVPLNGTDDGRFAMVTENMISAGDWPRWSATFLTKRVQDAIDGVSNAPDGSDWVSMILVSVTGDSTFRSDDYSTGGYPLLRLYYDTESEPFNAYLTETSSLATSGSNLSSDTSYPISVDITNTSRSLWDIGAYPVQSVELIISASASSMSLSTLNPNVILGSLSIVPGSANFAVDVQSPIVILGSLSLQPTPVAMAVDSVLGSVFLSGLPAYIIDILQISDIDQIIF